MIQIAQIFYGLPKKRGRSFAIFNRSHEEARVSSSTIIINDTFVSDASFGIELKWS